MQYEVAMQNDVIYERPSRRGKTMFTESNMMNAL